MNKVEIKWVVFGIITTALLGTISYIPDEIKNAKTPNWITILLGAALILIFFYIVLFYEKIKEQ